MIGERVLVLKLAVVGDVENIDPTAVERLASEIGLGEALTEFDLDVVGSWGEWEATS